MFIRGTYCQYSVWGVGGGIKPVPLVKNREENLYLANFPYFLAKIEHFLHLSKSFSLKMQ